MDAPKPKLRSVADFLVDADEALRQGAAVTAETWATGFSPLDTYLDGGLRAGDLTLIGGPQGLGKTTMALQMARNIATAGHEVIYLCYEHNEEYIVERLLSMESGLASGLEGLTVAAVRRLFKPGGEGRRLVDRLADDEAARLAYKQLDEYAERLHIVRANGSRTGLPEIRRALRDLDDRAVVFVDYLQKVHLPGERWDEAEKVTRVVEGLKDLALEGAVPVVAIVAANTEGISGGRTRLHHLRGSTALAYEADVVLMLNDKFNIVARHHLMYDTHGAERFNNHIVCSLEKNRSGADDIDMEFRKQLAYSQFDARGAIVQEQLVDGRVYTE